MVGQTDCNVLRGSEMQKKVCNTIKTWHVVPQRGGEEPWWQHLSITVVQQAEVLREGQTQNTTPISGPCSEAVKPGVSRGLVGSSRYYHHIITRRILKMI